MNKKVIALIAVPVVLVLAVFVIMMTSNKKSSDEAFAAQQSKYYAESTQPVEHSEDSEEAQILKIVTDSVNQLKASDANFKGHKVQSINMELTDSSLPAMNSVANGIISLFIKDEVYDYDFTNGVSSDPEEGGTITSNKCFPPEDKPFQLTLDGLASASKTMSGENTVYTVVIVSEMSSLQDPRPPHHNAAADTLDLSDVEIPMVTMNRVDFVYPGAEISVTISPDGKVIGYHEHLKIIGTGEVSGLGMTGYGTIEGYIDEKWDIQWK